MLAERLGRTKMAERAYRRTITKGFSMYAWSRLLDFYTSANNLRASVACIAELLDHFTDDKGISEFPYGLPQWIEKYINRLISKNGSEIVETALQEEKCEQMELIRKTLAKSKERKVYNNDYESS